MEDGVQSGDTRLEKKINFFFYYYIQSKYWGRNHVMAEWGSRIAINKGSDNIQHIDSEYVREDLVGGDKQRTKRRLELRVTVARDTMGVARDNTVKIRSVAG